MKSEEMEMLDAFQRLSDTGRINALAYTQTILQAENGIRKEYGLNHSSPKKSGKADPMKTDSQGSSFLTGAELLRSN
ncbi:hypothetical protein FACS189447_01660 [Spirochaetia bacterium]|nr:hypothetical protein FACS189447_01660 [Spirochaetia bacterium]